MRVLCGTCAQGVNLCYIAIWQYFHVFCDRRFGIRDKRGQKALCGRSKRMTELIAMAAMAIVSTAMAWWVVCTQRRLKVLEENIGICISRIGVKLSGLHGALDALLQAIKAHAPKESGRLMACVHARRCVITALSSPEEVQRQEGIIAEALDGVAGIAKHHPEIGEDPAFCKARKSVQAFQTMLRASHAQYNESVSMLNREIRAFPNCLIAGILGFRKCEHIAERQEKKRAEGRAERRADCAPARQGKGLRRHRITA